MCCAVGLYYSVNFRSVIIMTDHLFVAFNYSLIINKVRCDAKQESVIQDAAWPWFA